MNADNHQPQETPANVVPLADAIINHGEQTKAAAELEQKRKVLNRAFQLAEKQLERDATAMEESAIVKEMPILKRHQTMDQARALRMAIGWLQFLQQDPGKTEEAAKN